MLTRSPAMKSAVTIKEYEEVKQMMIPICSFTAAKILIAKCEEAISTIEAQIVETYKKASAMAESGDYWNAVITYSSILGYKDTSEQIKKCAEFSHGIKQQNQENLDTLIKQRKEIQKERNALDNKLAKLKKDNQQMISLTQKRDSLVSELS